MDDDLLMSAPTGSEAKSPIECGVVIFPEGMERDKSENLKSPAADRRLKRAARRVIFRRKLRKFHMLRALMDLGMCPLSEEGFAQWKREGRYPTNDEAFMTWLASSPEHNPYADRAAAAEGPVDKLTLGRALYHIAQRRGFKSSRKERLQEIEASEEGSSVKLDEETSQMKAEIRALTEKLEARHLTLGQYFYELFKKNVAGVPNEEKIRRRHTGRDEHYSKEFETIARVQGLDPEVTKRLQNILFFQRSLRIQRHTVGWCTLEKGRVYTEKQEDGSLVKRLGHKYRRCLESHPDFEYFRALCFLNNLRISFEEPAKGDHLGRNEGRALTSDERSAVLEALTRKTPAKMTDVFKKVFKKKAVWSNYRPADKAPIMPVRATFRDLGLPESEWQKALNALVDFDNVDSLMAWASKTYGFDARQASRFVCINPSTERTAYSLHAIRKILPFLERGMFLHKAIFCANLPAVIPDYAAHEEEVLRGLEACEEAFEQDRERKKTTPLWKVRPLKAHYRAYLETAWNVTEDAWKKLYIDTTETNPDLPLPPVELGAIRNPIVNRALTNLRHLVNALHEGGKIDADTHIFIELARNVADSNRCRAVEKFQQERRAKREEAIGFIKTHGQAPTEDLILRVQLWEEQGHCSVYTGQSISVEALFSACDIEHTIPRSRGGTSEMSNLTLCEIHYNREIKKNRLPTECPNATEEWTDPANGITYPVLSVSKPIQAWADELAALERQQTKKPSRGGDPAAFARARQAWLQRDLRVKYLRAKLNTFSITADRVNEQGFMPRQLVDTGIITRHAVDFLKHRYTHVYSRNGATTASSRKAWGIQAEDEQKARVDHTHHAVDACVVAALDTQTFTTLCTALGQDTGKKDWAAICPPPYPDFAQRINLAVESILVRHLPTNRQKMACYQRTCRIPKAVADRLLREGKPVPHPKTSALRGSLHDDTLYGRIRINGEEVTVLRKALNAEPNEASLIDLVSRAVDPQIKARLLAQIEAYHKAGVEPNKIPQQVFTTEKGLPIRKIRTVVKKPKNPKALRGQIFAPEKAMLGSGSDALRLDILRDAKGNLVPNYVTLLDEVKGADSKEDQEVLFSIYPMQLALIYENSPEELKTLSPRELSKRLYVVRKVEEIGRLLLYHHREARRSTLLSADLKKEGKNAFGASKLDFQKPEPLLLVSKGVFLEHMLFENVHFRLHLDGTIEWLTPPKM